jgi:hypothetical protein
LKDPRIPAFDWLGDSCSLGIKKDSFGTASVCTSLSICSNYNCKREKEVQKYFKELGNETMLPTFPNVSFNFNYEN